MTYIAMENSIIKVFKTGVAIVTALVCPTLNIPIPALVCLHPAIPMLVTLSLCHL